MAEALTRLPLPAGADAGQQPQADRGLLPRRRRRDRRGRRRRDAGRRQAGQGRPGRPCSRMLADEVGADRRAGRGLRGADRRSAPRPTASPSSVTRPRRRATRCSTRGWTSCSRVLEGTASLQSDRLHGRRRPERRARPRLLHRHRVRDPDGRLRAPRLDLLRRPLRRAGHRRPHHLPRRRHLVRRHPHAGAAAVPRAASPASRSTPTCVLVALPAEDDRAGAGEIAAALRGAAIPTEVSPTAQKYGKQIRYAERRGIPFVWFPQDDGVPPGARHPHRRAGRRRSAGVGPTGGGPAPRP